MNNDKPFVLRGGQTEMAAIRNRIMAIERIKTLSGIDLRDRSKNYLYMLDIEMYQRWYKDMPKDTKINEEWCQRATIVIKDLEKDTPLLDDTVAERVKQAYVEQEALPLKEPTEKPILKWWDKLFGKNGRKV